MKNRRENATVSRFLTIGRRRFLKLGAAGAATVLAAPAVIGKARAAAVVKLGHNQPITGPSAPYGVRAHDGAKLAVKLINEAGGFQDQKGNAYTFELIDGDMANDPRQAITLLRQYALNPEVSAVAGPTSSVGFVPSVPVAGQLGIVVMGNGGAPIKEWTPWAYRLNPVAGTAVPYIVKGAVKVEGIKRLAVLFDQTQDGQAGDAEICRELASELGYEVVAYEAMRANDQDVSPQISKIKAAKPDAIYTAAQGGDMGRVVSQIRQAGIDLPLITGYGTFNDPAVWDSANGGTKGGYTWIAQDLAAATGELKDFIDLYNKTFKLSANSFSLHGADAIYMIAECIRRTNSTDRKKIQEAISDVQYTTPLSAVITFKNPPHGDNLTPAIGLIRITGRGTYEVVPV